MKPRRHFRHIFFVTDLEGSAGVTHWRQTREEGPLCQAARTLLTGEVNAVIGGLFERAAQLGLVSDFRVTVWDGHGSGGLSLHDLDRRARVCARFGSNDLHSLLRRALQESPRLDALGFIGQHAMAGTKGNLCHTFDSRRIRNYRLNGTEIGELGIRALHAHQLGVPVVFCSGDDVACHEAESFVTGIVSVPVKTSRGILEANCLEHQEACERLRSQAPRILDLDPDDDRLHPKVTIGKPFVLEKNMLRWRRVIARPSRKRSSDDLLELLIWAED